MFSGPIFTSGAYRLRYEYACPSFIVNTGATDNLATEGTKSSKVKILAQSSYTINAMGSDDLAPCVAWSSVHMVLFFFTRKVPALEGLHSYVSDVQCARMCVFPWWCLRPWIFGSIHYRQKIWNIFHFSDFVQFSGVCSVFLELEIHTYEQMLHLEELIGK